MHVCNACAHTSLHTLAILYVVDGFDHLFFFFKHTYTCTYVFFNLRVVSAQTGFIIYIPSRCDVMRAVHTCIQYIQISVSSTMPSDDATFARRENLRWHFFFYDTPCPSTHTYMFVYMQVCLEPPTGVCALQQS